MNLHELAPTKTENSRLCTTIRKSVCINAPNTDREPQACGLEPAKVLNVLKNPIYLSEKKNSSPKAPRANTKLMQDRREKYIRRSLRAAGGEAAKLRYSTACTGQKTLPTSWRTTSSTCARSFSNSMRDSTRAASPERYFSARSNHTGSGVEIEGYLSI